MEEKKELINEIPNPSDELLDSPLGRACDTILHLEDSKDIYIREVANIGVKLMNTLKNTYKDVDFDDELFDKWISGIFTVIFHIFKDYIDDQKFLNSVIDNSIRTLDEYKKMFRKEDAKE